MKGLHRDVPKNQGTLQGQEGAHLQHHQRGGGGHQNPQGRCLSSGPYSRQGCTLVVMDKSQYVHKCMALLHDTKVYKLWRDMTKKLHRDIQEAL